MLYCAACTGFARRFRALKRATAFLRRITDDTPRPIRELNPEIPVWLATTIEILHAKDPSRRFQSADEVSQLFEQCLAHMQQPTAILLPELLRVPVAAPVIASEHRSRVWWIGGMAAALMLIVASALALRDRPRNGKEQSLDHQETSSAAPVSSATRWNDGSDEKVVEAENEVEELETNAGDDWKSVPERDK